jgi:hypothetical protein
MEEEPEDFDAWIVKNYPSKSDHQKVDKLKVHFGDLVIDRATKATANIVNNLNLLWNPVPPSGKSITDMLRASVSVLQHTRMLFRACAKKEGYLSGAWSDNEKLPKFVRL